MRILLAEDHRELRETTAELLRDLPAEVVTAADGVEAWRLFRDDPGFTLLVTDLDMPGMDGRELARRVRDLRPSCPIVFVTSRGRDLRPHELAGATVVVKPFAPRQLERAVAGAIAGDNRLDDMLDHVSPHLPLHIHTVFMLVGEHDGGHLLRRVAFPVILDSYL